MKTGIKSLLVTAIIALALNNGRAALAQWTFDSGTDVSNPFDANAGSIAPGVNGTPTLNFSAANPGQVTFSVPTTGGQGNNGGYVLFAAGNGSKINTSSFTLQFAVGGGGSSLTSLTFYYNLQGSQAPTTINWSMTGISGGTIQSSTAMTGTGWQQATVTFGNTGNFSSTTVTIIGTLQGGGSGAGTGNIGFDSFSLNGISAVPEPTSYAMAAFGLVFIGGSAGRYYIRRNRGKVEAA